MHFTTAYGFLSTHYFLFGVYKRKANAGFSNIERNTISSVRVFYIHIFRIRNGKEKTPLAKDTALYLSYMHVTHQKKKPFENIKSRVVFFSSGPFRSSNKVFTLRRYLVAHKIIDCEDFSNVFQHLIKTEYIYIVFFLLGVTFATDTKMVKCLYTKCWFVKSMKKNQWAWNSDRVQYSWYESIERVNN